jgi:membrane-bound ClpP family serine protease
LHFRGISICLLFAILAVTGTVLLYISMEWMAIVLLLVFSLALIVLEVIFIPGTTIFGIAGLIFAVIGIFISFKSLGAVVGFSILGGFVAVTITAVIYGFKAQVWRKFALNTTISSKVNEENKVLLQIGDVGRAISALRPSGKARFNEAVVEVHTLGSFLEVGCPVKIVRFDLNKIFVAAAD